MRRTLRGILLASFIATAVRAEEPGRTPLPLEQALDWKWAESFAAVLSPDEELAAVGIRSLRGNALTGGKYFDATGWPSFVADVHVWIYDVHGGPPRDLGPGREPSWSPDGSQLAFPSNRDGRTRLWLWERRTGEVRRVSDALLHYYPHRAKTWHPVQWAPDGRRLIAALWPEGMSVERMNMYIRDDADQSGAASEGSPTVRVYQPPTAWPTRESYATKPYEIPPFSDDPAGWVGFDDRLNYCDVGLIDKEAGTATRVFTGLKTPRYDLSPDGHRLAAIDVAAEGPRILVRDLTTSQAWVVEKIDPRLVNSSLAWSADSQQLAFRRGAGWATIAVQGPDSREVSVEEAPSWALTGASRFQMKETSTTPPDLWLTSTDAPPRRLTRLNPLYEGQPLSDFKMIEWHTGDGTARRGALFLPPGLAPGQRCPLVVWVYGSQLTSNQADHFGGDLGYATFLLTTRGYAVLQPDSEVRVGTPMTDIAKNILPGVERAVELGLVDPERIGLFGHSYGGYSVMSLIVQTTRFKAAVAYAGVYDLVSIYGQKGFELGDNVAWAEKGQGSMGGSPWEFRERYLENSPLLFLDRVQTPVLLLHGDQDSLSVSQADEAYVALRRLGKKVEYARYAGEGHDIHNTGFYPNRLDFWSRVIAWFDRYLGVSARAAGP